MPAHPLMRSPLGPLLRPPLRLAYRLTYQTLRLWWRLRRPAAEGAAIALWGPDGLLVVRPSYRDELDLPGGHRDRGETATACAVRELQEETGIAADPAALGPPRTLRVAHDHRRVTLTVLDWRPHGPPPRPEADRIEILAAFYATPTALRRATLAPALAAYLDTLEHEAISAGRNGGSSG